MKKSIALSLIIMLVVSLFCSCGKNTDATSSEEKTSSLNSVVSKISDSEPSKATSTSGSSSKVSSTPSTAPTANFPSKGYCAVGIVNKSENTVAVLSDTGVVKTMKYKGDAPTAGIVYPFTCDGSTITLKKVDYFPALDDAQYAGWELGPCAGMGFFYGGSYNMDADSAVFVRYSATEWRVFKGDGSIIKNNIQGPPFSRGYLYSPDKVAGAAFGEDKGTVGFVMIVGELGKLDKLKPATAHNTSFLDDAMLGWDKGDITIK